ncbi:flagellar basal body-associated protein FliL [Bacillus sp. FJAT-47783]|uniref:flagellar basal body-associated protein FliL n=1 Tax=Bacillus sp. FJAT-47783 TaxID=2922712 RepID=UPI001FACFA9C|nr:flagellar basal body-associated protein FliL [Bacillus sp. FJAT-47783]
MNKKLLTVLFIIVTSISIIGMTALAVVNNNLKKGNEQNEKTIDEIVDATVEVPEITTNVASGNIVQLSMRLETNDKKAKEELEKREFQVKDIVISVLANMEAKELEGENGMNLLKEKVKNNVNQLMQEGEVKEIYITSFILQ